jgi:hypothetical protein
MEWGFEKRMYNPSEEDLPHLLPAHWIKNHPRRAEAIATA